jgi:hypothetical protein
VFRSKIKLDVKQELNLPGHTAWAADVDKPGWQQRFFLHTGVSKYTASIGNRSFPRKQNF